MESVCIQESAYPHHRERSPLPRHAGEASGSNGIIASSAYGGSGERSEPKGACPPSVIDTDIFILHLRQNGVQYTITKIHAKKKDLFKKAHGRRKTHFFFRGLLYRNNYACASVLRFI